MLAVVHEMQADAPVVVGRVVRPAAHGVQVVGDSA